MRESKKIEILKCDCCGKELKWDSVSSIFGRLPQFGWLNVKRNNSSSLINSSINKNEWDFCSIECLKSFEFEKKVGLPKAYGGCQCECHINPNVMHCFPCCSPKDDELFPRDVIKKID